MAFYQNASYIISAVESIEAYILVQQQNGAWNFFNGVYEVSIVSDVVILARQAITIIC